MIVALVLVIVVVVWVVAIARRKRKRATSADAMTDLLGVSPIYRGRRWNVGRRPWL